MMNVFSGKQEDVDIWIRAFKEEVELLQKQIITYTIDLAPHTFLYRSLPKSGENSSLNETMLAELISLSRCTTNS